MSNLKYQFELIQAIRNFFSEKNFTDVLTPPAVQNPGMETHIHPFQLSSTRSNKLSELFLHTSPEFHMKKILAEESTLTDIFTITYCFRDEPSSPIHRPQFLMLEWYRKNQRYEKIMDDVQDLVSFIQESFKDQHILKNKISIFEQVTVQELFFEILNIDILNFLNKEELLLKIQKDFKDIPLPFEQCSWDDYYFLLFLNKIEPILKDYPYLLIKEFPSPLSALSTISKKDARVCERFEVYLSGIELCNCFNELTSKKELQARFLEQAKSKKLLYSYGLPHPVDFLKTMENYPSSSGIALGVERLLYCLTTVKNPFFI